VKTVFVHGAGRSGADAWPAQASIGRAEWHFFSRSERGDDPLADAERVVDAIGNELGAVVASSYGGIAALLAAAATAGNVRAVVLFEPACFSIARGRSVVESHIAALAPVFELAQNPSVSDAEFSRRFAAGMGIDGPPLSPDQVAATVPRLRATPPPWSIPVDGDVVGRIPSVVVSGAWNPLYEEVASELAMRGARHVILEGYGHRPQDHPNAIALIDEHLAAVSNLS
jgi:pimeloyl-ACP methyl ester carboxylesterase